MQQKNHYVDCPERIENNTTMTLLLDNSKPKDPTFWLIVLIGGLQKDQGLIIGGQ